MYLLQFLLSALLYYLLFKSGGEYRICFGVLLFFPPQEGGRDWKWCRKRCGRGGWAEGSSGSGRCTPGGSTYTIQGHAAGERGKTLQRYNLTISNVRHISKWMLTKVLSSLCTSFCVFSLHLLLVLSSFSPLYPIQMFLICLLLVQFGVELGMHQYCLYQFLTLRHNYILCWWLHTV